MVKIEGNFTECIKALRKQVPELYLHEDRCIQELAYGEAYMSINHNYMSFKRKKKSLTTGLTESVETQAFTNSKYVQILSDYYKLTDKVLNIIEDAVPELRLQLRDSKVNNEVDDWLD